ncbi:MAG: helix-turn-helix domain-containing protein [Nanoarchaeota archaeon]
MKYTLKKKIWCVKQIIKNITSISEISRNRKISRKTLYRWYNSYREYG